MKKMYENYMKNLFSTKEKNPPNPFIIQVMILKCSQSYVRRL